MRNRWGRGETEEVRKEQSGTRSYKFTCLYSPRATLRSETGVMFSLRGMLQLSEVGPAFFLAEEHQCRAEVVAGLQLSCWNTTSGFAPVVV